MISFIRGKLVEKSPTTAIIDCGGIGYELRISTLTYDVLDEELCTLLTHYAVSVDVRSGASQHQLYGFLNAQERDLFRQLITVSGVSATIAMTIMSTLPSLQIQTAIMNRDDKLFKTVKGVGPKLAQKICSELSEKVIPVGDVVELAAGSGNMTKQEALAALCSLGFDRSRADRTLNALIEESKEDLGVEDLIKKSLQVL